MNSKRETIERISVSGATVTIAGREVPVLEWCSIEQAVRWIVLLEAPVSKEHERRRWRDVERPDITPDQIDQAWEDIKFDAEDGGLRLRGIQATDLIVSFVDGSPMFNVWTLGMFKVSTRGGPKLPPAVLVPEDLPAAEIHRANLSPDGYVYWYRGPTKNDWVMYPSVEVEFDGLLKSWDKKGGRAPDLDPDFHPEVIATRDAAAKTHEHDFQKEGESQEDPDKSPRPPPLGAGNPGIGRWDARIKGELKKWPPEKPINQSEIARLVGGDRASDGTLKSIRKRIGVLEDRGEINLGRNGDS